MGRFFFFFDEGKGKEGSTNGEWISSSEYEACQCRARLGKRRLGGGTKKQDAGVSVWGTWDECRMVRRKWMSSSIRVDGFAIAGFDLPEGRRALGIRESKKEAMRNKNDLVARGQ